MKQDIKANVKHLKSFEFGHDSIIEVGKMYARKKDRKLCVLTGIQVVDYSYHTTYNVSYTLMDTGDDCCLTFHTFTKHWRPVTEMDIQKLGE